MQGLRSARIRNCSNSADQERTLEEQYAFFFDDRLPHVGIFDKNSEVGSLDQHSLDWLYYRYLPYLRNIALPRARAPKLAVFSSLN